MASVVQRTGGKNVSGGGGDGGITDITGDGTASGTGSVVFTLASVATAGSSGNATSVPSVAIDVKGRVTSLGSVSIQIAESQVTGLTADLAARATFSGTPVANQVAVFTTGTNIVGNTGFTYTSAGRVEVTANIEQLRLRYDASHYMSVTISSSSATFNSTGVFFFSTTVYFPSIIYATDSGFTGYAGFTYNNINGCELNTTSGAAVRDIIIRPGDATSVLFKSTGNVYFLNAIYVGANTAPTQTIQTNGNVYMDTIGKGIIIKSGTNARVGNSTLVAGTIAVSNTSITANSRVIPTGRGITNGGNLGITYNAGVGFTIDSTNASDTRVVDWFIYEIA